MRGAVIGFVSVLLGSGCAQLVGTDWTPEQGGGGNGAGGAPLASSTGAGASGGADATTSSTASTSVSSTASSTSASTGGGCTTKDSCPGTDGMCAFRTCTNQACGMGFAAAHAPCNESGGSVCNGSGTCVVCLTDPDCHGMGAHCVAGACQSCQDGMQDGDESDVDCGGSCPPCANGKHCNDKHDCQPNKDCTNGICVDKHVRAEAVER